MKKFLFFLYSLVTLFCLVYGFPMAIVNIGKDNMLMIVHFVIAGVGVVLLLIYATVLTVRRRKKKQ